MSDGPRAPSPAMQARAITHLWVATAIARGRAASGLWPIMWPTSPVEEAEAILCDIEERYGFTPTLEGMMDD